MSSTAVPASAAPAGRAPGPGKAPPPGQGGPGAPGQWLPPRGPPGAGGAAKTTLESLVTRYRREVAGWRGAEGGAGQHCELEIRFQDVEFAVFRAIYAALLAKTDSAGRPVAVGDGALSQTVNMIEAPPPNRGEGAQRYLRPTRIRELRFERGARAGERYVEKEPLLLPFRAPGGGGAGLGYLVALSAERPGSPFRGDEDARIRVKARVSFPLALVGAGELRPELRWRVDLTVTRELTGGGAAAALKPIVAAMFGGRAASPGGLLPALGLADDEAPAPRHLYRYEVEVELEAPAGLPGQDAVRPADIAAAAALVLRLANPDHVREAALQAAVYRAARYVVPAAGHQRRFQHELGLKALLPAALAITRADWRDLYPPKGLYVTAKADGRRALALLADGKAFIASDTLLDGFAPPGGPGAEAPGGAGDTILDGELVEGAGGPAFYAFDAIAVAGEDLTADGFERRAPRVEEGVRLLRAAGLPAHPKVPALLGAEAPAELERGIRAAAEGGRPYETDGLVFVEPGRPYADTRSFKWKPPEHNTIDCLARRAPPSVLGKRPFVDAPGRKLHFLFVGVRPSMFAALGLQRCPGYADLFPGAAAAGPGGGEGSHFPIQFSPSDAPLAYLYQHPDAPPGGARDGAAPPPPPPEIDGSIVEMRCGGGCEAAGGGGAPPAWELVRVRADRRREVRARRDYGNDYYTAELIWLNYVDPFPMRLLWEGPGLDYFRQTKSAAYKAQTAVTSYVKEQRIATLRHAAWVVDVGAGRGQDLGRYLGVGVRRLVAVDRDRAALSELVRKRYELARAGPRGAAVARARAAGEAAAGEAGPGPGPGAGREPGGGRGPAATTLYVLAADAGAPHAETLAKLGALGLAREKADALVCNLAVHYFLGTVEALRNFVALARGAVRVGGQVVLTVLRGAAVHAALAAARTPVGGTWDLFEAAPSVAGDAPPARKYSIRRLYSSERLEAAGQEVGVLHPFSAGEHYSEFLVNEDALIAEFAARGFGVTARASVANAIPEFSARNRALASLLTPADKQWLGLYGELILIRHK